MNQRNGTQLKKRKRTELILGVVAPWILALLFIGMGLYFLLDAGERYNEYTRLEHIAVSVSARITKIVEDTDSDDDEIYDCYITYEYEGVKYTDIYYETRRTEPAYGAAVTVQIDPENPARLRPKTAGIGAMVISNAFLLAGLLIFLYCGAGGFGIRSSEINKETIYTKYPYLTLSAAQDDINLQYRTARKSSIFLYLVGVLLLGALGVYCYFRFDALPVPISVGICWIFFTAGYGLFLFRKRDRTGLRLVKDKINSISGDEDSDIWHFANGSCTEQDPVSFRDLSGHSMRVGDPVYLVLNKKGRIERIYYAHEWSDGTYIPVWEEPGSAEAQVYEQFSRQIESAPVLNSFDKLTGDQQSILKNAAAACRKAQPRLIAFAICSAVGLVIAVLGAFSQILCFLNVFSLPFLYLIPWIISLIFILRFTKLMNQIPYNYTASPGLRKKQNKIVLTHLGLSLLNIFVYLGNFLIILVFHA